MCEKKNGRREVCGDATPPKLQPWWPPPFKPHPSVCTLAYINWISLDPIPAREWLDTSRNRLKTSHSSLNSTPTNISLRFKLRICSTTSVIMPRPSASCTGCQGEYYANESCLPFQPNQHIIQFQYHI